MFPLRMLWSLDFGKGEWTLYLLKSWSRSRILCFVVYAGIVGGPDINRLYSLGDCISALIVLSF